jgi:hypothetical protein
MTERRMRESKSRPTKSQGPAEPLPLDEVIARYTDKWILLRITAYDEQHVPSEGHVVAHGSRGRVGRVFSELAANPEKWDPPYYIFSAYPRIRTGEGFRAAIDEIARQVDSGARKLW